MIDPTIRRELAEVLRLLVAELDVPPAKYREAQEHYSAVGKWLNDPASDVAKYDPDIYPQGSFALGTVIRPLVEEEYDVDAVCLLKAASRDHITQQEVKNVVGQRLKEHGHYREMLDPWEGGRRCWTLKYADTSRFHLDILPSVPDPDWRIHSATVPEHRLKTAICVTDTTTWGGPVEWPTCNRSNPKGYVDWFQERMKVAFQKQREEILSKRRAMALMEKRAEVEEVPDYEVRTPLQRVIQLLKRHRDVRFNGDEDKPISIIITTLAARAYNNEEDLAEALLNVVPKMREGIEQRNGVYWVPNPVNLNENYADKWAETPRKAKLFLGWLTDLEKEVPSLATPQGFSKVNEYLAGAYGQRDAGQALTNYAEHRAAAAAAAQVVTKASVPSRYSAPHRAAPPWPMNCRYSVSISARYVQNGQSNRFTSDSRAIPKNCALFFQAETEVSGDFSVYWQVVNTGYEAASTPGGLRGDIFPSKTAGRGGLVQREATSYTGMHWIECFIVKNSACVARSGEFVVNIQ